MLDCDVRLAGPALQNTADVPSSSEARVKLQRAIDQRYRSAEVLAEIAEGKRGIGKDARIIAGHLQRSAREVEPLPTDRLRIFGPIVVRERLAANSGPGKCRSVTRIVGNRFLQKAERLGEPRSRREDHRIGTQI